MSSTSFYCSRTLALDFIQEKTSKYKEHKSNQWLNNKLVKLVNNSEYNFIVIDDEDINYMPKSRSLITHYSLHHICK